MGHYLPRVVDQELDELLAGVPAVALEGPKGVGKTVTSVRRARTTYQFDQPAHRALFEADPKRFDGDPAPVLLDEWQRLPFVWDSVRRSVDRDPAPGRFLLAGSAVPVDAPVHSGAGRIVSVRMRPLALAERGVAPAAVSTAQLLAGDVDVLDGECDLDVARYFEEIVASGFPGIRVVTGRARRALLDGYLQRIAQRDFREQGQSVRKAAALYAWMRAYAAATGTNASYNRILNAATPGEGDKPARSTTETYRHVLSDLWIVDPLPAWTPSDNRLHRLAQAPKHHLADPALAARLLGMGVDGLLRGREAGPSAFRDGTLAGRLFESLVALSVRVYAQASDARVGHFRTRNGDHEVDLVVERDDGRVLAIEVKMSGIVSDEDVRHLSWLQGQLGEDVVDALVVTAGRHAYRRADGIGVVPAGLLGP